ncbi:MAG: hypothetical protein DRO67_01275 [Candidatus Asgardarchaeum californiense]|nr:MAG: hypothetical protein DRO67_01275 [Candidatus Asgardarchaeum californiense]
MGSLSNYAENKLLDHVFGTSYTPPTNLYVALFVSDPADDASGTEASYTGYARKEITFGLSSSRRVTQDALVTFDQCTGGSNTITHWAVYDASSSGNLLAHGSLTSSKIVSTNKTPSIASGQVWIEFSSGVISNYLSNELLDHMFNNASYTQPTDVYVGLVETTEVTDSDTGSTIDELDMTGYARKLPATGWTVSGSTITNNGIIDFGTLTGTGETITSAVLVDSSTTGAGNLLFYDNALNQSVDDGDDVQYADGAFDLEMT